VSETLSEVVSEVENFCPKGFSHGFEAENGANLYNLIYQVISLLYIRLAGLYTILQAESLISGFWQCHKNF